MSFRAAEEAKYRVCKGEHRPAKVILHIYDTHDQWRYDIAGLALWGQRPQSFFLYCANYVIGHHRHLKDVRRRIRVAEREIAKKKRLAARELAERKRQEKLREKQLARKARTL